MNGQGSHTSIPKVKPMMKNKMALSILLVAGIAVALVLPGCGYKNPTDPFSGSGSGSGSTAGITKNSADTQTTAISAAASQ